MADHRKRQVFKTDWFSIDALPCGGADERPYYRLSCSDSVSIIARTVEGKLMLVRQYRPAIESYTIEPPSGYVDAGESPEDAVRRELLEETGYRCDKVLMLASLRICPSRINNTLYVFFGDDARPCGEPGVRDMGTELLFVTPEEFKALVLDGVYTEAAGLAMLFMAELRGCL